MVPSTQISLTIYIDTSLLGPGLLANLTFARVVGGVSNVIFQSKPSTHLLKSNLFAWQQAYQIGATETFTGGTLVSASTSVRDINYGYVCNWDGFDLQPQILAPANWKPTGTFGTTNLPAALKNAIWGSTGVDASGNPMFSPIYADSAPVPGLTNRAYAVSNDYVVSWEATPSSSAAGVYVQQWSDPFPFSYASADSNGYVSWGPPTPGDKTGTPTWYWYGKSDPGGHDPSKSIPSQTKLAQSSFQEGLCSAVPSPFGSVQIELGWNSLDWLSYKGQLQYASKMAEYLKAAKPTYLDLYFQTTGSPGIRASASLDRSSCVYDVLEGTTSDEKATMILQSLVRGSAPKYAPSEQKFTYNEEIGTEALGSFKALIDVAWKFVGDKGPALAAIGIPVAYLYIQGLINAKFASTRPASIVYTAPTINGAQGTASINITGINATDVVTVIQGIESILNTERARSAPPVNPPANLPTPDPVTYADPTNISTGSAAGLLVWSVDEPTEPEAEPSSEQYST